MARNYINPGTLAKEQERLPKRPLLVMLLVLAFSVTPRISVATLEYGRDVAMRYEDLVIIGILYFMLIAALTGRKIEFRSPITRILFIYLALVTVSTFVGITMQWVTASRALFYYLKELEYFVIFFIILNYVRTEKESDYVVWTIIVLGLVNCVYSVFQIATKGLKGYYGIALIGEVSPFGIAGYLSLLLLLSLALIASGYLKSPLSRGLVILNIFGSGLSLIFTGSRAFVYGTILASLVLLIMRKEKKVLVIALFILVAVLAGLATQSISPQIEERIINIEGISESISGRLDVAYKPVLHMLSQNPLTGYGKSITGTAKVPTEAHNSFLRVLLESGILGFIAFVLLVLGIIRMSLTLHRSKPDPYANMIATACILATVSMLVASIVQDAFTPVKVNELYWVIIGLTAVSYNYTFSQEEGLVR